MKNLNWFKFATTFILVLFMGLMALVTTIAYTRRSGFTGLDMAKMQQIRFEASYMSKASEETAKVSKK